MISEIAGEMYVTYDEDDTSPIECIFEKRKRKNISFDLFPECYLVISSEKILF